MGPLKDSQARILPKRAPPKPINDLHPFEDEELASDIDLEPPSKRQRLAHSSLGRQKWIPGGRGGGGRHIDFNGVEGNLQPTRSKDGYFEQKASRCRHDTAAAGQPVRTSSRRTMPRPQPRYSTATAAAAAVDGYKPREERGWEEFHPDLDLESDLAVIPSEQVDGMTLPASRSQSNHGDQKDDNDNRGEVVVAQRTPVVKRRPGRPPRRADSMLNGLHIPDQPRFVPPPGPNPREKLTLPRPSFKQHDAFLHYEQKDLAQVNFVDRSMAAVGYQESEVFVRPEHTLIRLMEGAAEEDLDLIPALNNQGENAAIGSTGVGRVEYDMDEQDAKWLDMLNRARKVEQVEPIKPAIFEITMTKIEKEWHALEKRIPRNDPKPPQTQRPRSSSAAAVNGEPGQGEEQDSKCSICDDGDCENANAIVFCDGCDLAVHQECYGVPYIPDGQWLCRKCLLLGRGTPTCIFCPNTEGAFKQTNSAKWAHILCAYWIPEASIGNMSLMEPVVDIEKVPYSRWRLTCFICQQKMGACIQCSHRNCYQAFHVTCARRAKMYLRMKAGQGVNSLMDKSQLKALCDKHVSAEWRLEHDTERATAEAKKYYLQTMKNRKWADSQASALAIGPPQPEAISDNVVPTPKLVLTHGSNKRSKAQKAVWRLNSGAPVIPDVICKSIEASLQRFNVRKKKDYVAEVCKYWTLKREARRGAPLLKRLQLQMDSFSSGDVTRRDYVAQGAAGRSRLERRIEFGERLLQDLGRLREMTELIKEREALKLTDATMLRDLVDAIYFPIPPMLAPILNKALQLDSKQVFKEGLQSMRTKLNTRSYASVAVFSAELANVLSSDLGVDVANTAELQQQVSGRAFDMTVQQRERRKLAKRIVKAVQPALEEALRSESEVSGRPFEKQIRELDMMLDNTTLSRRESYAGSTNDEIELRSLLKPPNGDGTPLPSIRLGKVVNQHDDDEIGVFASANGETADVRDVDMIDAPHEPGEEVDGSIAQLNGELSADTEHAVAAHTPPPSTNGVKGDAIQDQSNLSGNFKAPMPEPPTPPLSLEGLQQSSFATGGIPWYVEPFDPDGTTIHEERWTGPEVLREMSEELTDIDDEELLGLGGSDYDTEKPNVSSTTTAATTISAPVGRSGNTKKNGKQRRRWRGFK